MKPASPEIEGLLLERFPLSELRVDGPWVRVRVDRLTPGLRSGWKLHVSAVPAKLGRAAEIAIDVLERVGVPFKLASSAEHLEALNDGVYGLTQIGKAVTVYPPNEAEAAAIAAALAEALRGFDGPVIATDARFAPDAPVYYRYGPFDARVRFDASGEKRRIVELPGIGDDVDASETGDWRKLPKPQHLPDPAPPHDHLAYLRRDYLPVKLFHLSAKGGVFLGLERAALDGGPKLIKTAKAGAQSDLHGRDAVWALAREHAFMTRLESCGAPGGARLIRDGEAGAALVRPFLEGETLHGHWTRPDAATQAGRRALGRALGALAGRVEGIHDAGVIVRDLSPGNILVSGDDVVILDFETAHERGETEPPYRRGTVGFHDPAKDRWAPPSVADDHYALLALAMMAHTGAHPSWMPAGLSMVASNAFRLDWNASFGESWRAAFDSMGDRARFSRAYHDVVALLDAPLAASAVEPKAPSREFLRAAFMAAADPERWRDAGDCTVYDGAAGLALLVCEQAVGALTSRDTGRLRETAKAMTHHARDVVHIPGFYFGASGIGLALTALGDACRAPAYADLGAEILDAVDQGGAPVPDVGQGWAGYIWARLAAWRITGAERGLASACRAGERLAQLARPCPEVAGGLLWPWPEGDHGRLAGSRYLGFAHGVAGVTRVLMALDAACPQAAWRAAITGGLRTLHATARPISAPDDQEAVWWAPDARDETVWNGWCHGTPGVVKTLARACAWRGDPEDKRLLAAGVRGLCAANNADYSLCHGVASRLDALCDAMPLLDEATRAEAAPFAARDARLLAQLDCDAIAQAGGGPGADRPRGVMTGAAGVWRALLRWEIEIGGSHGQLLL